MSAGFARRFLSPHYSAPPTHLLSNGNYGVMITAAGSGYSRCGDLALTRWREDPTCDPFGQYVYLRDAGSGALWSAAYQPVGIEPDRYEAAFHEDRAEFLRADGPIATLTEILVSPDHDVEGRRVSVSNHGSGLREIELTSYAEVVLAPSGADDAHPAFSKMFVQTEFVAGPGALLAHRRRRDPAEQELWLFHASTVEGDAVGALQFETDRARFLGRGRDARNAACIVDDRPLSNTAGTVLDPVIALRRRVRIAPGQTARVTFWCGAAGNRGDALSLAAKHGDAAAFERIRAGAAARARARLRDLGMDLKEAERCQRIAGALLYCDASLRAPREMLERNEQGPAALWSLGISGDLPIVLLEIRQESDLDAVRQLLRAQAYWHLNRLAVDLVVLDVDPSSAPALQRALDALIAEAEGAAGTRRGKVVAVRSAAMSSASIQALMTAARVILTARSGPGSERLAPLPAPEPVPARPANERTDSREEAARNDVRSRSALEFDNGMGGFAAGGREYHVILEHGSWTPAPWINVIANAQFASLVSADGAGCTGSLNAHENQLTPWSNDPVSNPPAEIVYLRDERSGEVWSATPLPIRDPSASYLVRHGFGYTCFEHASHGISHELLQFVPLEDPLKVSRLRIVNRSAATRQLSITHYLEWVLGSQRGRTAPFIVTHVDEETSALLARNPWNQGFESRMAFMDMGGRQRSATGDRSGFLGRHGSLAEPAALLAGAPLSNRVGGGWDPCGALQTRLELRPGESAEVVMILGEAASRETARALIRRYRDIDLDACFRAIQEFWNRTLGCLTVETPDRATDLMLNGWLLYQTLACRMWARAAFYQTSGAYGFRDQLQDAMALAAARPELVREHLLRAAARQFTLGDVQHWWLPGSGLGVRTRMSDDRIWLAFVTAHYLEVTADEAVLDENVPFLEERPLGAEQLEIFSAPRVAAESACLYEHCARALDSSLAVGAHGLPLIGTGDWNDGMNRVGVGGRGESVWLGWFLHASLLRLAPLAERRGDAQRAARWREHARNLAAAIEAHAWDGGWYRRGYYDDGTPLGSADSEECRIDSIAQSWAVLSDAGDPQRAATAMSAVDELLVDRDARLVKLFTPPFDRTAMDPGYVKAYPPGLRENGGQYTHAATWSVLAFAALGDGDRAGELLALLNPIRHAITREDVQRYRVEPYVVCADVYSVAPHVGRGGWTWYTGSAGWMYRAGIEGILGIHRRGANLRIDPCVPRDWPAFEAVFVHGSSRYLIRVENPRGVCRGIVRATLDERELACEPCVVALVDDASPHSVRITLG